MRSHRFMSINLCTAWMHQICIWQRKHFKVLLFLTHFGIFDIVFFNRCIFIFSSYFSICQSPQCDIALCLFENKTKIKLSFEKLLLNELSKFIHTINTRFHYLIISTPQLIIAHPILAELARPKRFLQLSHLASFNLNEHNRFFLLPKAPT